MERAGRVIALAGASSATLAATLALIEDAIVWGAVALGWLVVVWLMYPKGRASSDASGKAPPAGTWEPTWEEYLAMPWEEASALPGDMNERWAERVTLDEFKTMSPEEAFKLPDHVYNPLSTRAFQDALIEQGA